MKGKEFMALGAALGGLAVLIGAFGAHALKDIMTDEEMVSFQKASFYHFIHAIILTFVGYYFNRSPKKKILAFSGYFLILGIGLFAFPLYIYSILNASFLAVFMPIGGICFTLGWFSLAIAALKQSH